MTADGNHRDGTDGTDGEVVFYWRRGCPYCIDLRLRLRLSRLRHRRVNIHQDPQAAAFVRSVAGGNETVPTVVVAGHAMVNPSKRQVMTAVARYAPHLLEQRR